MKGKSKNTASTVETQSKVGTILGPGAVFDGNLTVPETIRIDGIVNGNCNCKKNLVIGPEGRVEGNITAQNVVISGKVTGDIVVEGKLELYSTGKLTGNITARSLVIDEDAYFDGRCTMTAAKREQETPVNTTPSKTSSKKSLAKKIMESPEVNEPL